MPILKRRAKVKLTQKEGSELEGSALRRRLGTTEATPFHFNHATNPTPAWTAQPLVEASPWGNAPRYLPFNRQNWVRWGGLRKLADFSIVTSEEQLEAFRRCGIP